MSGVDEDVDGDLTTREIVGVLARRKAEAVVPLVGDALVIAADSLLDFEGEALGKPGSATAAMERWRQIRGGRGTLCTGQCLVDPSTGAMAELVVETTVTFADIDDLEIEAYVASGEPLEVAGAFTIDGRGAAFVERMEGDAPAVVGLSIAGLRRQLATLGIPLVALWSS